MKPLSCISCTSLLIAVLCVSAAAATGRVELASPRSRIARELVVRQQGSAAPERIGRIGRHELALPCRHVEGKAHRLVMEVTAEAGDLPGEAGVYRKCTAAQARRFALANQHDRVSFRDALALELPIFPAQFSPVHLPDGRVIELEYVFVTAGQLTCVVPEGQPELAGTARAALPTDPLFIRGQVVGVWDGLPTVLVEEIRLQPEQPSEDEPPWAVSVRPGEAEERKIHEPGRYVLEFPCAHKDGRAERFSVRLRAFRVVDLEVGGRPVVAELAETPGKQSYGLQGRGGLEPDHGMLFFFPRRQRPAFVMKTVSFPLSIAFVRADGTIVNIELLNPGDRRRASPPAPVNYVLEMEQGWFRDHGVRPGHRMTFAERGRPPPGP